MSSRLWLSKRARQRSGLTTLSGSQIADDLNTCKFHPADTALEDVFGDLKRGQQAVHQRGAENRVSFDPGTEVFAVVHPRFAHGPNFKLLSAIFDTKLTMVGAVAV